MVDEDLVDITITLSRSFGDPDLYASNGSLPTRTSYVVRPFENLVLVLICLRSLFAGRGREGGRMARRALTII